MAIELNTSRDKPDQSNLTGALSRALGGLMQQQPDVQDRIFFTEQLALIRVTISSAV